MTTRRSFLVGTVCSALAPVAAHANGDMFFEAMEIDGKPEFVFFGSVKDDQGNYLKEVLVSVDCTEPRLAYDSVSNVIGRYRSLDIGRVIRDLGYDVDPKKITVTALMKGYKVKQRVYRGRATQDRGAVEVNFIMTKDTEPKA